MKPNPNEGIVPALDDGKKKEPAYKPPQTFEEFLKAENLVRLSFEIVYLVDGLIGKRYTWLSFVSDIYSVCTAYALDSNAWMECVISVCMA